MPTDTGRDRQDVDAGSYVAPGYSIDNYYRDMEGEVMPRRPAKPCAQVGCPNKAIPGKSRCEQHQRSHNRQADENRDNSYQRGYTRHWRKVRAMVLRDEPLCRRCNQQNQTVAADMVHHIDEDSSNNSRDNLEPLCSACHRKIHGFGGKELKG